jgi:hypothetical protein
MIPSMVYQVTHGTIPDKCATMMKKNRELCESYSIAYIHEHKPQWCKYQSYHQSDLYRVLKAVESPCMIYLDYDCLLHKIPDLPENTPAFGRQNDGQPQDFFIFWTSYNRQIFADMLMFLYDQPLKCFGAYNTIPKDIYPDFPPDCYTHYAVNTGREPEIRT